MAATAKKAKVNPFKVAKKATKKSSKTMAEVTAPKTLSAAVDDYCDLHRRIKSLEAERETCKNELQAFGRTAYAERVKAGRSGNFKIMGDSSSVTYITQSRGSNIDQERYDELEEKYSAEILENCLHADISTVRIDPEVYAEHQDTINAAIAALGKKIGAELFVGMAYKAVPDILEVMPDQVESAEEFEELAKDLKLVTQLRAGK